MAATASSLATPPLLPRPLHGRLLCSPPARRCTPGQGRARREDAERVARPLAAAATTLTISPKPSRRQGCDIGLIEHYTAYYFGDAAFRCRYFFTIYTTLPRACARLDARTCAYAGTPLADDTCRRRYDGRRETLTPSTAAAARPRLGVTSGAQMRDFIIHATLLSAYHFHTCHYHAMRLFCGAERWAAYARRFSRKRMQQ